MPISLIQRSSVSLNLCGIKHDANLSRSPPAPFYIPLNITLYLCLVTNTLAAIFSPIQDCDEVFNFWEPAHYLQHGYGLQTWEYSPIYSIRSWLYVSLHAAVGKVGSLVVHSKTAEFYTIRLSLAFMCAACQTRLYSAICRTLSPRIGLLFVIIVTFSPGMFHASTAFLPSTFTMYMSMLGLASFLDWKNGRKTAQGIMWFGLGTIVGWPFAGALIVPLLAEEAIVSFISGSVGSFLYNVFDGIIRCLSILVSGILLGFDIFPKMHHRLLKLRLTMLSSESSFLSLGTLLHTTSWGEKVRDQIFLVLSRGLSMFETSCSTSMSGLSLPCYPCPSCFSRSSFGPTPLPCKPPCGP